MATKAPTAKQLQEAAVTVGWAWAVFSSSPVLMGLLKQAATNKWDSTRFAAAVMNSAWYRTQSEATRNWIVLQKADPATARQRQAARARTIIDTAATLGVTLNTAQVRQIRDQSLLLGWTDQQMQAAIGSHWTYDPKRAQAGLGAVAVNRIRQAANDYLVPLSDQLVRQWGQQVVEGTKTADDFTEYAKTQAKSLFPTLARQIDAGMTVQQVADPYKQMAGQQLELDPASIDMTQSKWRTALDSVGADGQHVPMTLADWQTKIRTDPTYGYDRTTAARQEASVLASQFAQMFGFQG